MVIVIVMIVVGVVVMPEGIVVAMPIGRVPVMSVVSIVIAVPSVWAVAEGVVPVRVVAIG